MFGFVMAVVISGSPLFTTQTDSSATKKQQSICRMSKESCKRLRQLIENDVEFIGTLDQDVEWYLTKQNIPVREPEPYGYYPTEKRDQ